MYACAAFGIINDFYSTPLRLSAYLTDMPMHDVVSLQTCMFWEPFHRATDRRKAYGSVTWRWRLSLLSVDVTWWRWQQQQQQQPTRLSSDADDHANGITMDRNVTVADWNVTVLYAHCEQTSDQSCDLIESCSPDVCQPECLSDTDHVLCRFSELYFGVANNDKVMFKLDAANWWFSAFYLELNKIHFNRNLMSLWHDNDINVMQF